MASIDRKTLKLATVAQIRSVEALLRNWDPIGLSPGISGPADEYDSYAPHIVSLVKGGCAVSELAEHLESLAVDTMGIGPSSAESRATSARVAMEIVNAIRPV